MMVRTIGCPATSSNIKVYQHWELFLPSRSSNQLSRTYTHKAAVDASKTVHWSGKGRICRWMIRLVMMIDRFPTHDVPSHYYLTVSPPTVLHYICHPLVSNLKIFCAMAASERPLSLPQVEQHPIASFQEYYLSSGASQLIPFAGTSRLQGESANPENVARIRFQSLPTEDSLFPRSSHAKGHDDVFLDQRKRGSQPPAQFHASVPLRRKSLPSKASLASKKFGLVIITYPAGAEAPTPTSHQYKKPIDSQLFTRERSYDSISTIYCKCYIPLPARLFETKKEREDLGKRFNICPKTEERCKLFLWEDEANNQEETAVMNSARTGQSPSSPSCTPREPPPYSLATSLVPRAHKQGGSAGTTPDMLSKSSSIAHSPPARGFGPHVNQGFPGILKTNTQPFDPISKALSKDHVTTNRFQGETSLHKRSPEGGIDNIRLLLPTVEKSPKNDTEVTHYHQGEDKLDGENRPSPTKKRKLGSFMDGCIWKDSSQVPRSVNNGTNAKTFDLFDQGLSRAKAHAMLDVYMTLSSSSRTLDPDFEISVRKSMTFNVDIPRQDPRSREPLHRPLHTTSALRSLSPS